MTSIGFASSDELWRSVRREAEMAMARDPVLGASLSAAILDHDDFGAAVAFQIGERLGKRAEERQQFARIAREGFLAAPELVEAAGRDLKGIAEHDPATTALLPPLLNFKGYVALQAFRASRWLWRNNLDLALLLQSESSDLL
jgi:serine O-acetyltransferase